MQDKLQDKFQMQDKLQQVLAYLSLYILLIKVPVLRWVPGVKIIVKAESEHFEAYMALEN